MERDPLHHAVHRDASTSRAPRLTRVGQTTYSCCSNTTRSSLILYRPRRLNLSPNLILNLRHPIRVQAPSAQPLRSPSLWPPSTCRRACSLSRTQTIFSLLSTSSTSLNSTSSMLLPISRVCRRFPVNCLAQCNRSKTYSIRTVYINPHQTPSPPSLIARKPSFNHRSLTSSSPYSSPFYAHTSLLS